LVLGIVGTVTGTVSVVCPGLGKVVGRVGNSGTVSVVCPGLGRVVGTVTGTVIVVCPVTGTDVGTQVGVVTVLGIKITGCVVGM
jgi:hypothetical protein